MTRSPPNVTAPATTSSEEVDGVMAMSVSEPEFRESVLSIVIVPGELPGAIVPSTTTSPPMVQTPDRVPLDRIEMPPETDVLRANCPSDTVVVPV